MAETAEFEYTPSQRYAVEVYQVYRKADLNKRYYGRRARIMGRWNTVFQAVSVAGSTATITALLSGAPMFLAIIAAAAALATTLAPLFIFTEKAKQFEILHFAYCELFADIQEHIRQLRMTEGEITPEMRQCSTVVFDRWTRLSALDEVDTDRELIRRYTDEVNQATPVSSLWLPRA